MSAGHLPTSPRAAFAHRDFRLYQAARFVFIVGIQMQSVAIGWQVYALSHDPLQLGWVGLAQFLPLAVLALPAGHVADRVERRRVLVVCFGIASIASLALALAALFGASLALLYALLFVLGSARAFYGPAGAAFLPTLVPKRDFPNAVAWSSTGWQIATIVGPALGGVVYGAFGPSVVYFTAACAALAALVLTRAVAVRGRGEHGSAPGLSALVAGLGYVARHKIVLGAISLDLFAVLLGGAVALLPALAHDVLGVGPRGLGLLRAAPAVGAALMALRLAYRPIQQRAGQVLLGAVTVFGFATIALGLSSSFVVSLASLVLLGASDMVSVFIRQNLVQLGTPDQMRGRVSAVNLVFVGASNELGELESGVTAAWLGVVPAVVAGGVGTLVVVLLAAFVFPELRRVSELVPKQER